jgi:bacillopeptidase F
MRKYRTTYTPRSVRHEQNKARNRIILSIVAVIVLGYFFLTWGLPALVGGLTYITHFNSKPVVKTTTDEDVAIPPPVLNIPYEATNTASISIKGYTTPDTKVEIYLDDELTTTADVNSDGSFQTSEIPLTLGTNNIYGKTILGDKKSLGSKNIKLYYDSEKPKVDLSSPPDNQEIKGGDKKTRVAGSTDPQNSVTINGSTVIVNGAGDFATDVTINEGDNTITIVVTNRFGNSSSVERKVKYLPS